MCGALCLGQLMNRLLPRQERNWNRSRDGTTTELKGPAPFPGMLGARYVHLMRQEEALQREERPLCGVGQSPPGAPPNR
jgi:hypothetical protein